jgi:hypothetical protein
VLDTYNYLRVSPLQSGLMRFWYTSTVHFASGHRLLDTALVNVKSKNRYTLCNVCSPREYRLRAAWGAIKEVRLVLGVYFTLDGLRGESTMPAMLQLRIVFK